MIKHIVFDVGGVLIAYRWHEMLMEHGLTAEQANEVGICVFEDLMWNQMDAGLVSIDDVVKHCRETYPSYAQDITWFLEHADEMQVERPEVWKRLPLLKEAGYDIYILSNYSEHMFQKHTADAKFWSYIDGAVVSYQVHQLKPQPEIYHSLLEKYHLKAEECFFFDDRKENTKGAENVGMHAFTVQEEAAFLAEMDRLIAKE